MTSWCLVRAVTGSPCPGCGLTRASNAALRGRLREASAWHPLWPAVWLYLGCAIWGIPSRTAPPAALSKALAAALGGLWLVRGTS